MAWTGAVPPRAAAAALALAGLVSACGSPPPATAGAVTVTSTDDSCTASSDRAASGVLRFEVTNTGSRVTQFALLADDGFQLLGEVESIGPGLSRDVVVQAAPGAYTLACKPGGATDSIRTPFAVTGSTGQPVVTGAEAQLEADATTAYAAYVRDQAQQLLAGTRAFAEAYREHDDARARSLYASTRRHWERIEPVAESFGDLDAVIDARESDVEDGQAWTGWHRIEKDLWPPSGYTALNAADRLVLADRLVTDTEGLVARTAGLAFTVDRLAHGAVSLVEEVAAGKLGGEEEPWSHTDLADVQGNLEGARVLFTGLRPVLERHDPQLAATIAARFAQVLAVMDLHRRGDGFVGFDTLTHEQVRDLGSAVDSLAEPLSHLPAAVLDVGP
ncbi:MAG: PbrT family lead (Pb2+) uptake porter [Frankiales bacterium]|nr:PbrT family lead (Pb2+) uptake porter [Frankiales bacterium]